MFESGALTPWEIGARDVGKEEPVAPRVLCAGSIAYILCWHAVRAIPGDSLLFGVGEVFSYCCHATLFFVVFYFVAKQFDPAAGAGWFYLQTLARIYPLFLAALLAFWGLHLVNHAEFLRGALLADGLAGDGLLTLWFVTLILLFYLAAPAFLTKYSNRRLFVLTVLLAGIGGALKVRFHLIDLRMFQFLLLFGLAVLVGKNPRWLAFFLRNKVVCGAAAGLGAGLFLAARAKDRPLAFGTLCTVAMCSSLPVLIKLAGCLAGHLKGRIPVFLGFIWFAAFLWHRPCYTAVARLFHPASDAGVLIVLCCVGMPLTLLVAFLAQSSYNQLFKFRP